MAPRTAAQAREIREATRRRIVGAALELFARFGFEQTSVRRIAQQAGISQGLLYHYFESKEALLREIFLQGMADVQDSFEGDGAGGPARLEHLVRRSFRIVEAHRTFWKLFYSIRMQPRVLEALSAELSAWTGSIRDTLAGFAAAAGAERPEIEARVLFALIDGIAIHYVTDPEAYPLEPVIQAVLDRYGVERAP